MPSSVAMLATTSLCCGYCSAIGFGVGTVRTQLSTAVTFMAADASLLLRLLFLFLLGRGCLGRAPGGADRLDHLDTGVGVDPDEAVVLVRRGCGEGHGGGAAKQQREELGHFGSGGASLVPEDREEPLELGALARVQARAAGLEVGLGGARRGAQPLQAEGAGRAGEGVQRPAELRQALRGGERLDALERRRHVAPALGEHLRDLRAGVHFFKPSTAFTVFSSTSMS